MPSSHWIAVVAAALSACLLGGLWYSPLGFHESWKAAAQLSDAQLRGVGLSKQKSSYLKDLSAKTAGGQLDFAKLPEMADDEVIAHLTQVKGIGVWTAHMFLMFSLRRPNVLPTGDYGIQMAMKKLYKKRKLPKPKDMEKIAKPWEPYRSVACWYLWRALDIKTL